MVKRISLNTVCIIKLLFYDINHVKTEQSYVLESILRNFMFDNLYNFHNSLMQ